MKMKHLIIEGFCDAEENVNALPCKGTLKIGVQCFECNKFSYTFCPDEIAISNEDGVVEYCIGYGGDMDPVDIEKREEYALIWNETCKEKMNEAYDLFMKQIKN